MNDYPYNRIILDIVELSQELRQQGKYSMVILYPSGSVFVRLCECQANTSKTNYLLDEYIPEGDCEAAMNVLQNMQMYVEIKEDLWAIIEKQ